MHIPRIYHPYPIANNTQLYLDPDTTHYISRVLRLNKKNNIIVFDGRGGEYQAQIIAIDKKGAKLAIQKHIAVEKESPLNIILAQGLSRGEKMDFVLQKSVELGVNQIVPLETEFSNIKLSAERAEKRERHWYKIITSACAQCGRNRIPTLNPITHIKVWLDQLTSKDTNNDNAAKFDTTRLILDPKSHTKLTNLENTGNHVCLLIGPEGGLSQNELEMALTRGFLGICLGSRILRTETAGIAAISAIQTLWGDLG